MYSRNFSVPRRIAAAVNRRTVLGAIGSLSSIGVLGYATRDPVDAIEVRFWLSDDAARYDVDPDRIREYLELALDLEFWTADVSYGGVVTVDIEHGYDVTTRGEWPSKLLSGAAGRGSVRPVSDANLLVTDGQMETAPTGAGLRHIATVGGARYLADLDPIDDQPDVVRYTDPNRTIQVVIHEVGHALGLTHAHGATYRTGNATVATPMLSTYAWDPTYDGTTSCGQRQVADPGTKRRLSYAFSACARERLRRYSGGVTP